MKLVDASRNLNKNKFVAALNKNAVKIFDDRKNLYTRLLVQYGVDTGVHYDERHLPESEAPTKYQR